MEYNFPEIEKKWQKFWTEKKTFHAENTSTKPKYYVLDMFPYPSGSGLHVGHPLGYIASDIYTRYKRLKGFNVLHPMGYDAFGLPAEQYAIQTGTHPAITTATNIARYREQMDQIGFSYDWDREVKTSDPAYYKWTQWTFIQLFHHWYNNKTQKAEPIENLILTFEAEGNGGVDAAVTPEWYKTLAKKDAVYGTKWDGVFTADQWNSFTEKHKQEILMNYRLAYQSDAMVNWCPALGTVLANDEVANGFSIRGGHPVERKLMRQWFLRITAYAQRLLDGLDQIDFSESLKEMQRNWIGRSEGAEVAFPIKDTNVQLDIFTTRPDTIFGATFMVIAPEHELAEKITTEAQRHEVEAYLHWAKNRSERERMAEVKKVTGVFTGAYCINPLNGKEIPIWIADYVLAGYGTGAIMAVPAHDSRDYDFAKHFNLPIVEVVAGGDLTQGSYDAKDGTLVNSEFINGMQVKEAIRAVIDKLTQLGIGTGTVNFRLRDAIFSRQRYWGEPFPIYYKNDIPYTLDVSKLPLELPEVDKYLPTESGDPPLARAKNWYTEEGYPYETSTMPGFAGSSGYYLRYMDPQNDQTYFSKEAVNYWQDVDLYIGGAEHATGHLIYSRFWNKFLFDIGFVVKDEPYKKLINQGMIQGVSQKARVYYNADSSIGYILPYTAEVFLTKEPTWTPMPVEYLDGNILTQENLTALKNTYKHLVPLKIATFEEAIAYAREFGFEAPSETLKSLFHDHSVALRPEVEKMSKSKYNVVNPDDLIDKYGADTLRLYEMFLGPLEQAKPWDTKGIEGVFRFIRKFWRLYHDRDNQFTISEEEPTKDELKILHRTIKKVQEDIERFSFNTAVSNFMICTNELSEVKCNKRAILEPLVVLISPYAPHMAEELWQLLGHQGSISFAQFPEFNASYLVENTFNYPVSFNGKMRFQMELPMDMPPTDVEKMVLASVDAQKWLLGNPPKKVIVVPKKIVNVVI